MKRGLVFSVVLALLIIPLISALNGYDDSPLVFFNNEWVKFTIIVLILTASIFYFLRNRIDNTAVAAIIAIGLSLLIAIPIMKRGLIEPFFEPEIIDWIAIIAIVAGLFFLIYWAVKKFRFWGFFVFLLLLVIILYIAGEYLPDSILYGPIGDWIDVIKGFGITTLVIIVIAFVAIWIIGLLWGRHTEKRGYKWEGYYKAKGAERAKRGWFGRKKDRGTGYQGMGPGAGI